MAEDKPILSGLRVIDAATYIAGPSAAAILGDFGAEVERITRQGRLTPDAWMRGAVGGPISAEALLSASRAALAAGQGDGVAA